MIFHEFLHFLKAEIQQKHNSGPQKLQNGRFETLNGRKRQIFPQICNFSRKLCLEVRKIRMPAVFTKLE